MDDKKISRTALITGYIVPGIIFLGMAFAAGSQKNPTFGLIGFLPFFCVGTLLILHGIRKRKSHSP